MDDERGDKNHYDLKKFFEVDWQKFNLLQQVICRTSERP